MELHVQKHTLRFNFLARTSRGAMRTRKTWLLKLQDPETSSFGLGECAPLSGLSPDVSLWHKQLPHLKACLKNLPAPTSRSELLSVQNKALGEKKEQLPSLSMGLEMALLDLLHGGKRTYFEKNPFQEKQKSLCVNGLLWMAPKKQLLKQILKRQQEGYTCLKMKIGALDFETECEVLKTLRSVCPEETVLRLDANGAFHPSEALPKLEQLYAFRVHSIEQPIAPQQRKAMRELCAQSPIPIALDEELIGQQDKNTLLEELKPAYVVLKPTLLGGFEATHEWIRAAEDKKIGWWITSALESNVGLYALAQFASTHHKNPLPQGLGTGQLYANNLAAPLSIAHGQLCYDPHTHVQANTQKSTQKSISLSDARQ